MHTTPRAMSTDSPKEIHGNGPSAAAPFAAKVAGRSATNLPTYSAANACRCIAFLQCGHSVSARRRESRRTGVRHHLIGWPQWGQSHFICELSKFGEDIIRRVRIVLAWRCLLSNVELTGAARLYRVASRGQKGATLNARLGLFSKNDKGVGNAVMPPPLPDERQRLKGDKPTY